MSRTSGPIDLAVDLDRTGAVPLRDQLGGQLRASILAGRLVPGAVLPATRPLAAHLGVSRGVVVDAYADLHQQGLVMLRPRSLPRVAERGSAVAGPAGPAPPVPRLDLATPGADPALFPRREWSAALRVALQVAPDRVLGELAPAGQEPLRQALADHLARARGAVASADRVIVCQGATQAIEVACRVLAAHGARSIAVEDPCRAEVRAAARRAGLEVVPVPVDRDGMLVAKPAAVDAVIVAPAHQFPTGAVLSRARRDALLATGLWVIEDDRGSDHRYDGAPPPGLQGAADDRVLLAGSASQSLAAGLRLGWLLVPAVLAREAVERRRELDGGSPALEQLALARMLETAAFDRHLRRARAEYARRRTALLEALADLLPDLEPSGAEAGLHLVLELPDSVDRALLAARAAGDRVRVGTTTEHRAAPGRRADALVVQYARIAPVAAPLAARAIRRLLDPAETARVPRLRAHRVPRPATPPLETAMPGDLEVELAVLALDVYGADRSSLRALAEVIRVAGADVVGLQNASGHTRQLADALGWPYWDAAHHVISRFPLLRVTGGLHVLVEVAPGGYLAHANIYLSGDLYGPAQVIAGASPGRVAEIERRVRVPGIAPVLGELALLVSQGVPALITGGFNAPCGPGWPVADAIAEAGFVDVAAGREEPTWPVAGFLVEGNEGSDRIDSVIAGGPVEVVSATLVGEPGGAGVQLVYEPWPSDHRAVLARVRVVPARVAPFAGALHEVVAVGDPVRVALAGLPEPDGRVALVAAGGDPARPARRRSVAEVGGDGLLALPTAGLRPGAYELVRVAADGSERSRSPVWLSAGAPPVISAGRRRYREGEGIELSWREAPGNRWDWVGIYPDGADPSREEPLFYRFCGARPSGRLTIVEHLPPGGYLATLMLDDGYEVLALAAFEVRGE